MARRRFSTFSLSFLDVMACGFGATVLVFLIINHATERDLETANQDLSSEVRMINYQVSTGQEHLATLQEKIDAIQRRIDDARRQRVAVTDEVEQRRTALAELSADTQAREEDIEDLKSEVEATEDEVEKLKSRSDDEEGSRILSVAGEGDRQYLTGLKVGGDRILIALDRSASMLDDTIVNVIRRRNMGDARKLESDKWQRALRTVRWLSAQVPLDSSFQIYTFAEEAGPVLEDTLGEWVPLGDGRKLDDVLTELGETVPGGGTSLENLFIAIAEMQPPPDNLFLITDSLPTMGTKEPRSTTVSGRQRVNLFRDATRKLPDEIPVNVIMFPMEGDPMAAAAYWDLAQSTGGAFLSPSVDWP